MADDYDRVAAEALPCPDPRWCSQQPAHACDVSVLWPTVAAAYRKLAEEREVAWSDHYEAAKEVARLPIEAWEAIQTASELDVEEVRNALALGIAAELAKVQALGERERLKRDAKWRRVRELDDIKQHQWAYTRSVTETACPDCAERDALRRELGLEP